MTLGILTEDHERIIADLDHIAEQAGILKQFICQSAHDFCPPNYIDTFQELMTGTKPGIVVNAVPNANFIMMALGGICIRNYIDARLITAHKVIDFCKDGVMEGPTVLMIPNYFVGGMGKGDLPAWQVQLLVDVLHDRQIMGKKTVIYVSSMKQLASEYGVQVHDFLNNNYLFID